jgi:peptidoglycan/xylan/chitin deacetylase (PgdA/CDA1 family)
MLSSLHNVISKISGRLPGNLGIRLDNAPVCTFTFDDCPRSALENAGAILERYGLVGTFFVAGATLEQPSGKYAMLGSGDLKTLVRRGHELGCHSYSHRSFRSTPIEEMRADLDRNREVLLRASGVESLTSFAYPYGEANWTAKTEIAKRFAAARGVRPGINGRILDLAQLRAVCIQAEKFSERHIQSLIQRTLRTRGWLIFCTHEVESSPSFFGCTERQFERTVEMVVASRIEVLSMRSAVGRIMHRANDSGS